MKRKHSIVASWVFGPVLVLFLLGVFVFGPEELPGYKQGLLPFLCALVAGLFGFFLTGTAKLNFSSSIPGGQLTVNATSGVALFVLVFLWSNSSFHPVDAPLKETPSADKGHQATVGDVTGGKVTIYQHSGIPPEHFVESTEKLRNSHDQKINELKERLNKAELRAEAAEQRGEVDAQGILEALRKRGDPDPLLAFLYSEKKRTPSNALELDREIAAVAYLTGRIKEAEAALKGILGLLPEDLVALNLMALIHQLRGALDKAEEGFERVLSIAQRKNDVGWRAAMTGNLGSLNRVLGNLDKAENLLLESLRLRKELGDKEGMAADYGNLGLIYETRGDLDKAEEMHLRSLKLEEALGNRKGMATDYGNLGIVYKRRGDLTKAKEMFLESLKLNEELGHKEGVATSYASLGSIYRKQGNLERAEEFLLKALKLEQELGSKEGVAQDYGTLGNIYYCRGKLDKAEEFYLKALELNKEMRRKEGMAINYANLGHIYENRRDSRAARESWAEAVRLFHEMTMPDQAKEIQGWIDQLEE